MENFNVLSRYFPYIMSINRTQDELISVHDKNSSRQYYLESLRILITFKSGGALSGLMDPSASIYVLRRLERSLNWDSSF